MKKLATVIRKSTVPKISKNNRARPDDLKLEKGTNSLTPAAIDLDFTDVREFFNEKAWKLLEDLCKSTQNKSVCCLH